MGNLVEFGSHGMVVAVLFMVKKSVICVNRAFAVFFRSVIVTWCSVYILLGAGVDLSSRAVNQKAILNGKKYSLRIDPASVYVGIETPQFFAVERSDSSKRRGITNCGVVLYEFRTMTRH